MGEIIEKRRRFYSGLDADKASIPAGGKAIQDVYFATDTKISYFWDSVAWIIIPLDVIVAGMIKTDAVETLKIKNLNVTAAKAELGFGRYVERLVNAPDKQVGNFITDGTWKVNGLDLSGIVPAGAKAVMLDMMVLDDAVGSQFSVQRDAAHAYNRATVMTQVANILVAAAPVVAIEGDRLLDYYGGNVGFTSIDVTVAGWFI